MHRLRIALPMVLVGIVVAGSAGYAAETHHLATTGFQWHDITGHDGVVLKSNVIAPATPGRHPGIVLVASWGLDDDQYLVQARALAEHGYVALSYNARGFWFSGGQIEVAGADDIADASTVVDWLVANTSVDPGRVGIVGMSYGAGIGLLAAAHDNRIRAAASLSGWADLEKALVGNGTRRAQAAWLLQTVATLVGHPSDEMNQVLADYWANRNADGRARWARGRSVAYRLDALDRNRPAVLIVHSYGDSVFAANQMVELYNNLGTPKRLELAPGDHLTVEAPGLFGLQDHVWTDVRDWFDHYLSGVDNGIGDTGVVLRPFRSAAVETYPNWDAVSAGTQRLGMSARTIRTGTDTTADGGLAVATNGFAALTGVPPQVWLPSVSRRDGAVWVFDPYPDGPRIRGVPVLHLSLTSPEPSGTVVAYLYDVDGADVGRLMSQAPYTWTSPVATVDVPMQVNAFDLPAGHRLAVVVDTKDPLYLDANSDGSTITVHSGSWLELPTR